LQNLKKVLISLLVPSFLESEKPYLLAKIEEKLLYKNINKSLLTSNSNIQTDFNKKENTVF